MGGQRMVPTAAFKGVRRLFVGSSVNQRGLQYGSPVVTAEAGSCVSMQGLNFSRHPNDKLLRESSRELVSQLGPAQVGLHRHFSQSAIQQAKQSSQNAGGKGKRAAKTAAEIASHNALTQMRPITFECRVCRAISVTRILKDPYDRGVTILRCMDCRSVNLISDQLGLFKEPGSMQRFLREGGVDVRNGPEGRYELTPENLAQTQPQVASSV